VQSAVFPALHRPLSPPMPPARMPSSPIQHGRPGHERRSTAPSHRQRRAQTNDKAPQEHRRKRSGQRLLSSCKRGLVRKQYRPHSALRQPQPAGLALIGSKRPVCEARKPHNRRRRHPAPPPQERGPTHPPDRRRHPRLLAVVRRLQGRRLPGTAEGLVQTYAALKGYFDGYAQVSNNVPHGQPFAIVEEDLSDPAVQQGLGGGGRGQAVPRERGPRVQGRNPASPPPRRSTGTSEGLTSPPESPESGPKSRPSKPQIPPASSPTHPDPRLNLPAPPKPADKPFSAACCPHATTADCFGTSGCGRGGIPARPQT
jgi:hypothetical protein